jgi:hypothetical protein
VVWPSSVDALRWMPSSANEVASPCRASPALDNAMNDSSEKTVVKDYFGCSLAYLVLTVFPWAPGAVAVVFFRSKFTSVGEPYFVITLLYDHSTLE